MSSPKTVVAVSSSVSVKLTENEWSVLEYLKSHPYSSTENKSEWFKEDIDSLRSLVHRRYAIQQGSYPPRYRLSTTGEALLLSSSQTSTTTTKVESSGVKPQQQTLTGSALEERQQLIEDIRVNLMSRIYYNINHTLTENLKLALINLHNLAYKMNISNAYCYQLFNDPKNFTDLVKYSNEYKRWALVYPLNHNQVVQKAELALLYVFGNDRLYNPEEELPLLEECLQYPELNIFKDNIITKALETMVYARDHPEVRRQEWVEEGELLSEDWVREEIQEVIALYYREEPSYDLDKMYQLDDMFFSKGAIQKVFF